MKRKFKIRYFMIILLVVSIIGLIFPVVAPFINISLPRTTVNIIYYVTIATFSISVVYLYMIYIGNRDLYKMEALERRLKLWNSISYRVKKAGESSFNEMPLGIIVYDKDYTVEWANNYAKEIFLSPLVERKLELIHKDLYNQITSKFDFEIVLYGKIFSCSILKEEGILYLTDITNVKNIQKKYGQRMMAMGIISLDNFDQALTSLDAQQRALQISNIIGLLAEWTNRNNVYLKGYSEDQYMLIMDHEQLETLMKEEFKILDDVKSYCVKENLRISCSIGIACEDVNASELFGLVENQLNLAINRGGNQCVVLDNGKITYYGGKTISFESRSPIYVRVQAEELKDNIQKADKVYILTHKDMDSDAFGACVGMMKFSEALGKDAKIIFDAKKVDQTIKSIHDLITREHANMLSSFILPREALSTITESTLIIIVDCQYQDLLLDERVYKKAKHIAILDHHRRNNKAINNYEYLYIQSSASSTVELVVEMFEFMEKTIELTSMEATWMLMGIIVDTNNLMYRTSYRTFNALSTLQKYGAEMAMVKRYLREDFDEYVQRMTILNNLEIVEGQYGITICSDEEIHARDFLARIADNLISVSNIKAAFCIGRIGKDEIGISARSLDEVNVQIIMERLNGGGHFNNAATQIKDKTVAEAREMLVEELKKNVEGENQNMKIILTKEVKGKGKEGEIIDIPAGHANYLIRNGQAILATVDNIKQLETEKLKEKAQAEKHLSDMRELKEIIEKKPVTVGIKVGTNGKLFGSVTSKMIAEEYKIQNGIVLDKRKMLYEKEIDAVGTYVIPIQLHKEVTAKITVYIVEKE